MPKRSFAERLEAIPAAEQAKAEFMARLSESAGNPDELAFRMAEAIDMAIAANGLEVVGRDGRVIVGVEHIFAAHCMIAAAKAFREATKQAAP